MGYTALDVRSGGLNSDHATRYPHQFSGGQRQRIGIATEKSAKDTPVLAVVKRGHFAACHYASV
jgi:ABC-type oligopeptide transport system ATPase subunit